MFEQRGISWQFLQSLETLLEFHGKRGSVVSDESQLIRFLCQAKKVFQSEVEFLSCCLRRKKQQTEEIERDITSRYTKYCSLMISPSSTTIHSFSGSEMAVEKDSKEMMDELFAIDSLHRPTGWSIQQQQKAFSIPNSVYEEERSVRASLLLILRVIQAIDSLIGRSITDKGRGGGKDSIPLDLLVDFGDKMELFRASELLPVIADFLMEDMCNNLLFPLCQDEKFSNLCEELMTLLIAEFCCCCFSEEEKSVEFENR